jgi:hypothetical protein
MCVNILDRANFSVSKNAPPTTLHERRLNIGSSFLTSPRPGQSHIGGRHPQESRNPCISNALPSYPFALDSDIIIAAFAHADVEKQRRRTQSSADSRSHSTTDGCPGAEYSLNRGPRTKPPTATTTRKPHAARPSASCLRRGRRARWVRNARTRQAARGGCTTVMAAGRGSLATGAV